MVNSNSRLKKSNGYSDQSGHISTNNEGMIAERMKLNEKLKIHLTE